MRRLYYIIAVLLFPLILQAQPKEVSLIVTGEGATKEEATNNALRSAVEQAFGVFVSANTEILNDEIVKDEIATISSGNVKSFKEISYVDISIEHKSITLEAVVSIGQLIEYSRSHGSKAEFTGAVFGANLRLREQKRRNEPLLIVNLLQGLSSHHKDLFNASIAVNDSPYVGEVNTFPFKDQISDFGLRRNANLIEYNSRNGENVTYGYYRYETAASDGTTFSVEYCYPKLLRPREDMETESTFFLPIKITLESTSLAKSVFREFNEALSKISLTKEECEEYDAEHVTYYGIELNNKPLFFREYLSVLLLGDLIHILNRSVFEDWEIVVNQSDGVSDRMIGRYCSNVSGIEIATLCPTYIGRTAHELYLYSMLPTIDNIYINPHVVFSADTTPIHLSYGNKYDQNVKEGVDRFNYNDFNAFYGRIVMNILSSLYFGANLTMEPVWQGNRNTEVRVIHLTDFHGRRFRIVGHSGFNFVLFHKDDQEPIELLSIEPPINEFIVGGQTYYQAPKYSVVNSSLYNDLSSGMRTVEYEYEFKLPIPQKRLEKITSLEIVNRR